MMFPTVPQFNSSEVFASCAFGWLVFKLPYAPVVNVSCCLGASWKKSGLI